MNQCQHLADVKMRYQSSNTSTESFDVCICTALAEPELKPLIEVFNLSPQTYEGDVTRYSQGYLSASKTNVSICAASAPEMGVSAMACLTTKMLARFRPKVCFLVGICAGINAEIGDIVVAESSFTYETGKVVQEAGELEAIFHPNPRYLPASPGCIEAVRQFNSEKAVQIRAIASEFTTVDPPKIPAVEIGPVACGAAVIESENMVQELKDQNRKIQGLEMESYGFYLACRNAADCNYLMIKAVCDSARPPKEDGYQAYCSFIVARFLQEFLLSEEQNSEGLLK